MSHDFYFSAAFQRDLIAEIRVCMALCVAMQHKIKEPGFVRSKDNDSPVTDADHIVQERLETFLRMLFPKTVFIGEESPALIGAVLDDFWLCDPIDGTRSYARGDKDFAINLAYIRGGIPVFGLIAAPVDGDIAITQSANKVVIWDANDHARDLGPIQNSGGTRLLVGDGRSGDAEIFAQHFGEQAERVIVLPSALKFIALLRGQADYYLRAGQVCEWDIAAGDALLRASGGAVTQLDGQSEITYGRAGTHFLLDRGLIARRVKALIH